MTAQPHTATLIARSSWGVAWRHFRKWITVPANLIPTVMFPLLFFTSFAGGLSAIGGVPGFDYPPGYTAFQYSFSLLQMAVFGGVATGFSIAGDFGTGFSTRLFLTMPHRSAIILGYVISTLMRFALLFIFITGIAFATGMTFPDSWFAFCGAVGLALILNIVGTLWGIGVMMRARSVQAAPLMQMPVFLSLFLAPVFVPLELLDGWIHAVATVNPFSYVLDAVRSLYAGRNAGVPTAVACATLLLLLALVWSFSGVRRAARDA